MQNWILDAVRSLGLFGIAGLMLLENVFPPLPSEFIMPLAGYLASQEPFSFWAAVLAGTAGSVAGTFLWYVLGRSVSEERLCGWIEARGVWLAMRSQDVDRARAFFERYGAASVFFGRLVPVVRTLISVPAGFSGMPVVPFLVYSTLGSLIWIGALAYAGHLLGSRFPAVGDYLGVASWIILATAAVVYVLRVVQLHRGHASESA